MQRGTIYHDTGSAGLNAYGKRVFKNCWRAEVTVNGHRFRHRADTPQDCERWIDEMCRQKDEDGEMIYYKSVKSVPDLEVSCDGLFRYQGRKKHVNYAHTVTGRRSTARINIMFNGKTHYYQASKLVAETWKVGYTPDKCIIYKDGNCHNIKAENLQLTDDKGYHRYIQRNNSGNRSDTLEQRKRKLQLVIDEATMTLNYFKTLDMTPINDHVRDYLYPCLMGYCLKTLQLGEKKSMDAVQEVIGNMYEKIMDGMCLYDYERYCKKCLHDIKTKGTFGEYWWKLVKPIKIEVEHLNMDCLWEKFKVRNLKKKT